MKPINTLHNILALTGGSLLLLSSAHAASVIFDTKGDINTNERTILEATGNSHTWQQFNTSVGAAFTNGTGGVANPAEESPDIVADDTITLNYGASNSLVMTMTVGNTFKVETRAGEATSGDLVFAYNVNAGIRTFTLDTPLLALGIFNTDRGNSGRNPQLIVNYQDGTSAETSGASADAWYFHSLSGTAANPIVGFSLSQSAFVRWDDLGFIAIPEPSTALLGGLGLLALLRRRR